MTHASLVDDLYAFLVRFAAEHNHGPTLRETASALGIGLATAARHVAELEAMKYVSRDRQTRTFTRIGDRRLKPRPSTARTETREAVRRYVTDYQRAHGFAPTQRDVAQALGVSLATAAYHVRRLSESGQLQVPTRG